MGADYLTSSPEFVDAVVATNLLVTIMALRAATIPAILTVSNLGVTHDALSIFQEHLIFTPVACAVVVTRLAAWLISITFVALFLSFMVVPFAVGTRLASQVLGLVRSLLMDAQVHIRLF